MRRKYGYIAQIEYIQIVQYAETACTFYLKCNKSCIQFPKYAIMPIVTNKNNAHVPPIGQKAIVWRCASIYSAGIFLQRKAFSFGKMAVDQTKCPVVGTPPQSTKKGKFL